VPSVFRRGAQSGLTDQRLVAGGIEFVWEGIAITAEDFQHFGDDLDRARIEVTNTLAAEMLAYMQANAPWQDQTGYARSVLAADVSHGEEESVITLHHGVYYGDILETHTFNGVSYAIIGPTMAAFEGRLEEMLAERITG
jgi:hypothetical protein